MKRIKIFDEELIVNDSLCGPTKDSKYLVEPSLRLYIKLTDACNAGCSFCANENSKDFGNIDFNVLEFVIRYLKEKNYLHGISITGGEPMIYPEKLNDLLNLIWKIDKNMEIAISTNGLNLTEFANMDKVNMLESIHISRHHYDDKINEEIFKSKSIATTEDILFLQDYLTDKQILNINTLVMKGYIENLEEIKKMLDYVGETGVYKTGFVSLMKCNEYSKKHFINFNDIFTNLDENFLIANHFYKREYCECIDGIYTTNNAKIVEFYARMVKECNCPYTTQLVYTSDNKVTAGFGKKVLYKKQERRTI